MNLSIETHQYQVPLLALLYKRTQALCIIEMLKACGSYALQSEVTTGKRINDHQVSQNTALLAFESICFVFYSFKTNFEYTIQTKWIFTIKHITHD